MFPANGNDNEALTIYTQIVKNKQYPQAGRLRVNMGNICVGDYQFNTK